MRELDVVNASTLVDSPRLFQPSDCEHTSLVLQRPLPKPHCELNSSKARTVGDSLNWFPRSVKLARFDSPGSCCCRAAAATRRVPLSCAPSLCVESNLVSCPPTTATMIEIPSPAKFLVHARCSTELEALDFKDDSGSSSSDEDVFLPENTDATTNLHNSTTASGIRDHPGTAPISCLSDSSTSRWSHLTPVFGCEQHEYATAAHYYPVWKWHQTSASCSLRSPTHQAPGCAINWITRTGPSPTARQRCRSSLTYKPWLDRSTQLSRSGLSLKRDSSHGLSTMQRSSPDGLDELPKRKSKTSPGSSGPVERVKCQSLSGYPTTAAHVPISSCDSTSYPDPSTSDLRVETESSNAVAYNLSATYSLHVERLKLLSAFCALQSRGFVDQTIDKVLCDRVKSSGYERSRTLLSVPWSVQRCELKWLLCILISAPMNSMRSLSQLIHRISPSLELTAKLRLPWHTANSGSNSYTCPGTARKSAINRHLYDMLDSGRSASVRINHSDRENACHSPYRSHTKHRISRAAAKLSYSVLRNESLRHHQLTGHKCQSSFEDDKDRKTYASVAAAAVPASSSFDAVSGSSWLTPAEAALYSSNSNAPGNAGHRKHRSPKQDSSSERSSCTPIHSDHTPLESPTLTQAPGVCTVGPKVSVVSARTSKEPLVVTRHSLSRVPPWNVPSFPSSRRNAYLAHPALPGHSRVSTAFSLRSPFQSAMSCPLYPPACGPYSYMNQYEFSPRKTRSFGDYDTSSVSSNLSHCSNLLVDSKAPSTGCEPTSGVFVDLTGYDVTVSVERLPPLTDGPVQPRGPPGRRSVPSDTRGQVYPSDSAPPYSLYDPYRSSHEHRYSLPMVFPASPPPPYSECAYPNPLPPPTSTNTFVPVPYRDVPWNFPAHSAHTTAVSHTTPSRTPPSVSHMSTPPWIIPSTTSTTSSAIPTYPPINLCPCHSALIQLRWLTSQSFAPFGFCACGSASLSPHVRSCGSLYCPIRRHVHSTEAAYMATHDLTGCHAKLSDPTLGLLDDHRPRPTFQRQFSCPEDPLSAFGGTSHHTATISPTKPAMGISFAPELDLHSLRPDSTPGVGVGANGWVYVPEPIRVPRSQDVYNALRTCLVPHYELRDYATSAPPPRQWRRLEEPSKDGFAFTLMCYNLLSPSYATQNMYPYCPSWALNWDYRRRAILDEIRVYHANIICLQEVETNQFEEIFKPELEKLKYDAVFLPKSRCRTMDMKDCKKVDGCAIFWQVDKFEKLYEFHHEFMFSCSNMCENPSPLIVNRVMTRDNVALGVIFETKGAPGPDGPGGRQFCVTTGHIHWDPELSDVKMIQTILWTAELWAYIDQFLTGSGDSNTDRGRSPTSTTRNTPLSNRIPVPGPSSPAASMPVILCGDLNSLPESGVVEFLMRGSLPKSHTDFLNNGFKYMFEDWRLLEKWAVDGDTLRHRFTFDRAYRESQGMQLTNFTYDFKGMIDYVLFSRQHFHLLGSLDQIHESWFAEKKIVGCPHVHIPSDHFALLVELELKPTPQLASLVAARSFARSRCRSEGGVGLENGQSKTSGQRIAGCSVGSSSPPSTGTGTTTSSADRQRADSVGLDSGSSDANSGPSASTGKHRKR